MQAYVNYDVVVEQAQRLVREKLPSKQIQQAPGLSKVERMLTQDIKTRQKHYQG
jgi:hypothetical protein